VSTFWKQIELEMDVLLNSTVFETFPLNDDVEVEVVGFFYDQKSPILKLSNRRVKVRY